MPHRHLIRVFSDGRSEWLAATREGRVLQGPQPGLPDAAAEETVLLLPAEQVLLLDAPRVARSVSQLAQALPYAIEDALAGPVEAQHIAFDETGQGDSVAVAVIARAELDALLQRLRAHGIEVDRCYAETQCLAYADGRATLWYDDGRALIRSARSRALSLPAGDLAPLTDWLRAQQIDLANAQRWRSPEHPAVAAEDIGEPALAWLARQLPKAQAFNLLQGGFRPRRRAAASGQSWRWAAMLAALALLGAVATTWVEQRALQTHVAQRQEEMVRLLRQAMPEVQRIVDPVAQLRGALGQQSAGGDQLFALLGRIAPLLGGGTRLTLDGVEFRGGVLELTVMAVDVATLDGLREQLAQLGGLQVELTAATPGSQGIEGRLRVRGGGA